MFYDNPNCKNLSPWVDDYGTKSGIFVFKKAISDDLIKLVEEDARNVEEKNISYENGLISWYEDKALDPMVNLVYVWDEISNLIGPEYVIHPMSNLLRIKTNHEGMFIHSDSPGKDKCHLLSQTDVFQTCCLIDFGIVAYFGDYEGGEIFYPKINKDGSLKNNEEFNNEDCFSYKPEKGDVLIHSAFDRYAHGVRPITSGTRYAFSCFSLKASDNPGTFYNYKTEEYNSQIGNMIANKSVDESTVHSWLKPLKENPQFTHEKVKEMKQSGLEGEDLANQFFSDMSH